MNDDEWKIAVDGAAIFAMPEDERWAWIISPEPAYMQDIQAEGNAERHKTKLIVNVKLSDGRSAQYYMNRTSARAVANALKTDLTADGMKAWVGAKIVWGKILDQMIGGQDKKVLYITEASKEDPKEETASAPVNPETAVETPAQSPPVIA